MPSAGGERKRFIIQAPPWQVGGQGGYPGITMMSPDSTTPGISVPSALNKIRFIAEKVLWQVCDCEGLSWGQGEPTLERMIGPLVAAAWVPRSVATHLRTVQA